MSSNQGAQRVNLTDEQIQRLDYFLLKLLLHSQTAEGRKQMAVLSAVVNNIQERKRREEGRLSERDKKALAFIRAEQVRGHTPAVRGVAAALGLKSSRSGHVAVNKLRKRGLIP